MSASHDSTGQSSGTAVTPATASQLSMLGSSDPNWLNELRNLGYMPSSGSWSGINTTPTNSPNVGIGGALTNTGGAVASPNQGLLPILQGITGRSS